MNQAAQAENEQLWQLFVERQFGEPLQSFFDDFGGGVFGQSVGHKFVDSVLEQLLHANPAGYLVREIQRGGYREKPDPTQAQREYLPHQNRPLLLQPHAPLPTPALPGRSPGKSPKTRLGPTLRPSGGPPIRKNGCI